MAKTSRNITRAITLKNTQCTVIVLNSALLSHGKQHKMYSQNDHNYTVLFAFKISFLSPKSTYFVLRLYCSRSKSNVELTFRT